MTKLIARLLLAGCVGAIVAAMAIYLTPLKWITVIEPTIKDIDSKTFYADFKVNPDRYIFIDVRPKNEYDAAHAVGSKNIPLVDLYDMRHVLPKHDKEIVLICTTGRSSGIAYSYLQHYGFFNIERIAGGLVDWIVEGLPVEGTAIEPWNSSDHTRQSLQENPKSFARIIQKYECPRG